MKTELPPSPAFRFGPFRLDLERGSLHRDGEEIALTPKAFTLLQLFLERPDALLSKKALLGELWPGTHVEENNLNQQIAALRRALGEGWIETVPRRGFRFVGGVRTEGSTQPERGEPGEASPNGPFRPFRLGVALVLLAGIVTLGALWAAARSGRHDPLPAPPNPRAQEEYLAGRFAWNRRTRADFQVAAAHFRRAITLDPPFAAAWSGLGDSLNLQGLADEGEKAARRALELDDRLAEAHTTLGNVQLFRDWDFPAAQASFDRALELDPSYATARQWRAFLFAARGDAESAVTEMERAIEIEPLSRILATDGAQLLYMARHFERAEEQVRTVLRLDPHFGQAYNVYADILSATGRHEEALTTQRQALDFGGEQGPVLAERLARAGKVEEARALLATTDRGLAHHAYGLARAYFALGALPDRGDRGDRGDLEMGFQWLETALRARDSNLLFARLDPVFDPVRGDPRWPALPPALPP